MSDLVDGQIGPEAKYKVSLDAGKLIIAMGYDGVEADAEMSIKLEVDLFLDKVAALIPGKIDDAVIAMLKGALK